MVAVKKTMTGTLSEQIGCQVFAYVRVSTNEQDGDSQMVGIDRYLKSQNIKKVRIITDKVSGSTPWRERALATLDEIAQQGDWLIISELSRIGRTTADVLDFLAWATKKGIQIYAVKNALKIDESIQSKIFTTVLALASEIERDFIRQRTKEGMANAAAKGKKVGRPSGPAKSHRLDAYRDDILSMLEKAVPKAAIARMHGVSVGTINRAIKCWSSKGENENG